MKQKTCGRDPACDLVIEHPSVSRFHARIELAEDGVVWVQDDASSNGTFLHRCDSWTRIGKASLCIGDGIRLGEYELPLEQITALFSGAAKVRLRTRRFPFQVKPATVERIDKPRRNPATGRVEEQSRD
ncbi:MAG: FHA domain-containing protein [Xanthomonadales bacterium]|nr:FHA domain-containing protein [Xanthomonadales bacterium]